MFEKSEKKSSYVNAKYVTFPRISIIIDIILTENSHHINIRKKAVTRHYHLNQFSQERFSREKARRPKKAF